MSDTNELVERLTGFANGTFHYKAYRGKAPDGVPQLRSDILALVAALAPVEAVPVGRMRTALAAALGAQTPPEGAVTEAQGWRPIETAPMDGTCILAAVDWLVHPVILFWNAHHDMRCWESPSSGVPYYVKNLGGWQPTHWMPLPTPPVNQSEGADRG